MKNRQHVLLGFVALLGLFWAVYWLYPTGYGQVTDDSYQAAKAIYAASLDQNLARIEVVNSQLLDGKLDSPDHERRWLEAMIDEARSGNWRQCTSAARRMMEDQRQAEPGL